MSASLQLPKAIEAIQTAAKRGESLTRQLLTFSRKQVMQPQELELNEIVSDVAKMLQRILGEDISLQFHYSPNLPPVHADSGMMEQVLLNLAVNARDAMPNGGKLTIETTNAFLDESYPAVELQYLEEGAAVGGETVPAQAAGHVELVEQIADLGEDGDRGRQADCGMELPSVAASVSPDAAT